MINLMTIQERARIIVANGGWGDGRLLTFAEGVSAALAEFKPDVAYMPVPRCESCGHWDKDVTEKDRGRCMMMYEGSETKIWPDYRDDIITMADFGCVQWKEKLNDEEKEKTT